LTVTPSLELCSGLTADPPPPRSAFERRVKNVDLVYTRSW
jgi:hypothetical protein